MAKAACTVTDPNCVWFKRLSTLSLSKLESPSVLMAARSCVGAWKHWGRRNILAYSGLHWSKLVKNIVRATKCDVSPLIELSPWLFALNIYLMWHKCQPSAAIACYWVTLSVILAATTADSCLSLQSSLHLLTKSSFTHQFNVNYHCLESSF